MVAIIFKGARRVFAMLDSLLFHVFKFCIIKVKTIHRCMRCVCFPFVESEAELNP